MAGEGGTLLMRLAPSQLPPGRLPVASDSLSLDTLSLREAWKYGFSGAVGGLSIIHGSF